jgi:hypothetical protein
MTRLHVLWLHQEKIIPETGTLLRPRLSRLVHRTLATEENRRPNTRTKAFALHSQIVMTPT